MGVFEGNSVLIGGGATRGGMTPSVDVSVIATPSVDKGVITPSDGPVGTEEGTGVASNN
jgi:hypothetical protein